MVVSINLSINLIWNYICRKLLDWLRMSLTFLNFQSFNQLRRMYFSIKMIFTNYSTGIHQDNNVAVKNVRFNLFSSGTTHISNIDNAQMVLTFNYCSVFVCFVSFVIGPIFVKWDPTFGKLMYLPPEFVIHSIFFVVMDESSKACKQLSKFWKRM